MDTQFFMEDTAPKLAKAISEYSSKMVRTIVSLACWYNPHTETHYAILISA